MSAALLVPLLLLLLAATLWLWKGTATQTERVARERFDFKLAEAQFAIHQRLLAYEQILRGGVSLFAARQDVTREEWHDYVRALDIEKTFPGIQGIGYAVALPGEHRADHLRKLRSEGFPEYDILPPGERPEYAPIVYIEPFDWRNLRAFGYDMFNEPTLRAALLRARDSGLAAASGKVRLVQETGDGVQNGFMMCLPVYRPGEAAGTIEQRRAALKGYVCSPFRMSDLMQGILGPDTLPNIRLRIFDGAAGADSLMYDSLEGAPATLQASFSGERGFDFNGHRWTQRFDALPAFEAAIDKQRARLVLLSGVLVSGLVTAVAWALLLNRRRAHELAAANGGLRAEIEERSKLEAELKRARNAAEAANEAKSDFLANVSHELRTPLTLILAPLEQLLAAPEPPASWRNQLERVQRNALLLLNRVNDILDFSKAEAGKCQVLWQAVDLVQTIEVLAGDASVAAERKGCRLSWQVDPALASVCLDLQHFEKIVLNLIGNAIKFTPARGIIEVRASVIDEGRFELAVEDTGIGIATDKLSLLFERFSQVEHSATRNYGGTGIGLALVKELVTLMGGTVGVDSEAGRGSRFFVRLPRGCERLNVVAANGVGELDTAVDSHVGGKAAMPPAELARTLLRQLRLQDGSRPLSTTSPTVASTAAGAPTPDAGKSGRAHQAAAALPQRARPRVLVVDDSPEMRDYIAELLRDDCELLTADDGEQAWAMLQRVPADVIVSDVMMPRLDGFGLTARVKANTHLSHIPMILLTARGGADASVSGLETGADDYVTKPFSPAELKARVGAALRMGQVQAELREKSHQAGMAQIATNVLHNIGNVLNSVNISASLVISKLRASSLPGLGKAVRLMTDHAVDLGHYLSADVKGKLLPAYLGQLSEALAAEQHEAIDELGHLARCIDHIKEIVATQQAYAGASRATEAVLIGDLVDDALRMNTGALARHRVAVEKQLAEIPMLPLDRHRLLLILINLISNAKYAMDGVPDCTRQITLRAEVQGDEKLHIVVADNGEGILPEHMGRLFEHGFTTRKEGHGFGLHSCALAAREMGGTLSAHSEGRGHGATFTLELPIRALGLTEATA